jgi:hypothetical protein
MTTWPYRVVHKHSRCAIHQVYYDEEGELWTCSEDLAFPEGDSLQDLRQDLEQYRAALDLPALECADVVPGDEEPSHEMQY